MVHHRPRSVRCSPCRGQTRPSSSGAARTAGPPDHPKPPTQPTPLGPPKPQRRRRRPRRPRQPRGATRLRRSRRLPPGAAGRAAGARGGAAGGGAPPRPAPAPGPTPRSRRIRRRRGARRAPARRIGSAATWTSSPRSASRAAGCTPATAPCASAGPGWRACAASSAASTRSARRPSPAAPSGASGARPAGAHRQPHPQRARGPRAALPDAGPGRLRLGQHLLVGLRHRGDHAHPRPGRRRRPGPDHAPHPGHRRPAGRRRHLLPADHQGLPQGGRQLHRQQRQPGGHPRPGGRLLHPGGLRAHRRRLGQRRRRRPHLGLPRALREPGADRRRRRRPDRLGQPARPARVRAPCSPPPPTST